MRWCIKLKMSIEAFGGASGVVEMDQYKVMQKGNNGETCLRNDHGNKAAID